jgi:hypothetical protein
MTVREFLNNANVSLDDEIMIEVQTTEEGLDYIQHFPIEFVYKVSYDNNTIGLSSNLLNKYINEFIL